MTEESDVVHISKAFGALRRWWMIGMIAVMGVASYTATSMAIGAATSQIATIGHRVDKLEDALSAVPEKLGEVREALSGLRGEVRALRRSTP